MLVASAPLASVVESLAALAEPWKDFYEHSTPTSVGVVFLHLGSLFVGGGLALASDRATRRLAGAAPADRARHLAELGLAHRPVVVSLAVAFASGALLFLTDVETFATSPLYWAKMALVALLLGNGLVMTRLERGLAGGDDARLWALLRRSATVSASLWLLTLLAGTALANS